VALYSSVSPIKSPRESRELISYDQAIEALAREERFQATVYAMNTLLIEKGVYSAEEFRLQFRQWAQKELSKK
jgi:hypothetical protein